VVVARQQVVGLCREAAAIRRRLIAKVVDHRGSLLAPRPARATCRHSGHSTAEAQDTARTDSLCSRRTGRAHGPPQKHAHTIT